MSDERTRRTMIGTGAVLVMSVSQLVHVCYELHSLTKDHSTWVWNEKYYLLENYLTQEFHTAMPGWILNAYHVSHFIAMMLPTLFPWIFVGKQLFFGLFNMVLKNSHCKGLQSYKLFAGWTWWQSCFDTNNNSGWWRSRSRWWWWSNGWNCC